ncbi:hypothetical protein CPB84DRAFT_1815433 [Gymnopilus junonius]|uniref:F-box domain-containing protein n=1 Tax=Gymnopilus junonius TaxID=109634 RepID=A0A9P5TMX2_GYMJU|nr:hypothetical protein CPB84DRAFT_1815433 [Gymnopilus junonius]
MSYLMDVQDEGTQSILPATTDDVLFSVLSPADLLRYSRTCRSTHAAVSAYIRRTFTIHDLLSRFFTPLEINTFRYYQSRTGMFISGSTALQFFNRETYPDSDLDIYVEHRYSRTIAFWLLSIGYSFVPRPRFQDEDLEEALRQNMAYDNVNFTVPAQASAFFESTSMGYFGRGVANVYNFTKSDPSRKIQLITAFHSPLEVILNFHSTCVMNVITHDTAYSLYPIATFEQKRALVISTEGSKQDTARTKYSERGWDMVERLTYDEVNDPRSAFAPGSRYVGDSKCWKIPISPSLDLRESFVEINSWNLRYRSNLKAVTSFKILLIDNLRYSYLVVNKSLQDYLTPALVGPEEDEQRLDRDIMQLLKWKRELS